MLFSCFLQIRTYDKYAPVLLKARVLRFGNFVPTSEFKKGSVCSLF